MMMDSSIHFSEAILAIGLEPPETIIPGQLHRFPGYGKSSNNRAGWCLLFDDEQAGCFGDWSTNFFDIWRIKNRQFCSKEARIAFVRRVQAEKKKATMANYHRQAVAAERAARIWRVASAISTNHPYIKRKCIRPYGAKLYQEKLVLPIMNFNDKITSVQFITGNGDKKLLAGGLKQDCYIPVDGDTINPSRIIICEGWATGCSLAEDNPDSLVLSAIDAGNLKLVALGVRASRRWPDSQLIIAGDDDRLTTGNPGVTHAKEAAIAANALLALPQWPDDAPDYLTDFNDLAVWLKGGVK